MPASDFPKKKNIFANSHPLFNAWLKWMHGGVFRQRNEATFANWFIEHDKQLWLAGSMGCARRGGHDAAFTRF
ncbi:hypothetical protein SH139x_000471 [Planctomycetaceae bacterium SH139]